MGDFYELRTNGVLQTRASAVKLKDHYVGTAGPTLDTSANVATCRKNGNRSEK